MLKHIVGYAREPVREGECYGQGTTLQPSPYLAVRARMSRVLRMQWFQSSCNSIPNSC